MDKTQVLFGMTAVAASAIGLYVYSRLVSSNDEHNKPSSSYPTSAKPTTSVGGAHFARPIVTPATVQLNIEEIDNTLPEDYVSVPYNVSKDFSIGYDKETKKYTNVPPEIVDVLKKANLSESSLESDFEKLKEVLYAIEYNSIRKSSISNPFAFSQNIHIHINRQTNEIEGMPEVLRHLIKEKGLTDQQIIEKPDLIKDLVYSLQAEDVFRKPEISSPVSYTHDYSIYFDEEGNIQGAPPEILEAIKTAGYAPNITDLKNNPRVFKGLLYNFDYNAHTRDAPKISSPVSASRDFNISYDSKTGTYSGVPPYLVEEMKKLGLSVEEVAKDPVKVKEILYGFEYDQVKPQESLPFPEATPLVTKPTNVTHVLSIKQEGGVLTGIPQPIVDALQAQGLTVEQAKHNPEKVKDILSQFDYDVLFPKAN